MSTSGQRHDGGWQSKDTEHRVRTQIAKLGGKADWPVYRSAIEAECYSRNSLQCLQYPFSVLIEWQSEKYLQYHPELAVKHAVPLEGSSTPTSDADYKVSSSTTDDKTSGFSDEQKAVKMETSTTSGATKIQALAMNTDWKLHCIRMGKMTYITIYNSLHTNQHHLIQGVPLGDPFKLWTTLKNFYQRTSLAARRVLWSSFWSMTGYMRAGSNLDLFVAHLEDLARRLNEMGETVAASHILGALLNGLPKDYEAIITVIDAELPPDVGAEIDGLKFLEEVKDKLRDFAEKHKLTTESRKPPRANAFFGAPTTGTGDEACRNHASGRPCATTPCPFSHKGGRSQSRPPPIKKKDSGFMKPKQVRDKTADICKNCGKKGHWMRDCRAPKKHAQLAQAAAEQPSAEEQPGIHWAFHAPLDVTGDGAVQLDIFDVVTKVFKAIEDRQSPSLFGSEFSSDVTGDGASSAALTFSSFPRAFLPTSAQELDLWWRLPLTNSLYAEGHILRNDLGITHSGCCFWQVRASALYPPQVWRDSVPKYKRAKAMEYKLALLHLVRQLGPDFCLSDMMGPEFAEGSLARLPLFVMMDCASEVEDHPCQSQMTDEQIQSRKFYTLMDQMRLNDGYYAEGIIIALDAYFHGAVKIILATDDFSINDETIKYYAGPMAAHVPVQILVLWRKRYELCSPNTLRQLNNRRHGGASRIFGDSAFANWITARQRLIPFCSMDRRCPGPEAFFAFTIEQLGQDSNHYRRRHKVMAFIKQQHCYIQHNLKTSPLSWLWTLDKDANFDLAPPHPEFFLTQAEDDFVHVNVEHTECELEQIENDFVNVEHTLTQIEYAFVHESVETCRTRAMDDIAEGNQCPLPQMFADLLLEVEEPLPSPSAEGDVLSSYDSSAFDMKEDSSDSDDETMAIKFEQTNWRCKICDFNNTPPYAECTMCANTPAPIVAAMQLQATQRRQRHTHY
jgi:hypothetical protein